jgi:hypothetical protein
LGKSNRHPDPADLANLDHPSHKQQWLELARAMGRLDARRDFELIYGKGKAIDQAQTRKPADDD